MDRSADVGNPGCSVTIVLTGGAEFQVRELPYFHLLLREEMLLRLKTQEPTYQSRSRPFSGFDSPHQGQLAVPHLRFGVWGVSLFLHQSDQSEIGPAS